MTHGVASQVQPMGYGIQLSALSSRFLVAFKLYFGFVFFKKFSKFVGGLEQARPLFVIQGHGKTAQAVNADASLFADPELQTAGAPRTLLFEFRQTGLEFFISRFGHEITSEKSKITTSGAGDGNRTRDIQLGKLAFYR